MDEYMVAKCMDECMVEKVSEIWTVSLATCGGVATGRGCDGHAPTRKWSVASRPFSTGANVGTEAAVPTFAPGSGQRRLASVNRVT